MKYKAIKVNGRKCDEHRHIMERAIGRKLDRNEVVHHVNGNTLDNRIENLVVLSLSEHSRLHSTGRVFSDETKESISESRTGIPNPNCRKLGTDEVDYIRKHYKARNREYGCRALARRFGVTHAVVEDIVHNRTYKT